MSNESGGNRESIFAISLLLTGSGLIGYIGYGYYRKGQYKALIKEKKKELSKKKADLEDNLVRLDVPFKNMKAITSLRLKDLMAGLNAKAYTPVEVLQAYQAKALTMDKKYNFITDINYSAELNAEECVNSKKSSLRGIPISIKDSFSVIGCYSTSGIPSFANTTVNKDSIIVHTLRIHGAVPFVLTNMSQTDFPIETSNPLFGETLNPYNKTRTCGGGSGGDGAILASGASLIGLSIDFGGSIRIPAHYCGVYALKPTSLRISRRHLKKLDSNRLINPSPGPMARRIDDLVDFFKAVTCGDLYHLDPHSPPLCFNEKIYSKKHPLKIGYYLNLGGTQIEPIPAVTRAVLLAKEALEKAGHSIVSFEFPDIDYAIYELYFKSLFSDGGRNFINNVIGYNPVDDSLLSMVRMLRLPNFMKYIISGVTRPFNKHFSQRILSMAGVGNSYNLGKLYSDIECYRECVLTKWQNEKLDAIICPVLPIVAPKLNTSHFMIDVIAYTAIYNLLDYPAGVVPVTKVTKQDVDELVEGGYLDAILTPSSTEKYIVKNQENTEGLPVGVQCASLIWREEICLRIMRDIANNLELPFSTDMVIN